MAKKTALDELAALAAGLRARIEAEVDGFPADESARAARVKKAAADFEFFARTYFPHYINKPNSRLHDWLYARLPEIAASPDSVTQAIAAPRGEAKSTLVSQLFVLWSVATGKKRYAMIGMDAFDQAAIMLEAIKAELEANPRLAMDYPDACGIGRVWQAGVIVTANGCKIEAVGSGKRIRGRRHGPHRPDLFIGDDLENDENVRTPEQRDKLQAWLTKAVLKLGGAGEKFDCIVIGTVLHYDSVLSRLLKNPLWHGRTFKAIEVWPENMSAWDEWSVLYKQHGEAVADAYYAAHREDMDAGAVVSWPAGRPLVALMKLRARDGAAAFDSELQNDPLSTDGAPFSNCIDYWRGDIDPRWVFYGAVDPSMGRAGAGRDPSAILVGGFDRETGVLRVIEARIARRPPDRIIDEVIALQRQYGCVLWAVENVQFQEFFRQELVKRSAAAGCPVPARGVTPSTDKALRIESLQPHLANKLILLRQDQTTLIDQLRHFPRADHDDGPDALHMLWMAAATGYGTTAGFQSVPRRSEHGANKRMF
ncbi:MAG: phage terminase large subunit [Pseudomonadota bacterium]